MSKNPLVSIITPSYQHAAFLRKTIDSVLQQSYPHIEYWVMDGGSKDGTLEILQSYTGRLQWVSEPDGGQVDAINKGLQRTTGDILAYLNSDDVLMPGAVQQVVDFFAQHPDIAFVYGDALAIDEHERHYGLRANVQACDFDYLLHRGDPIVQPAAFWRRELWEAIGQFDGSYNFVFDYEYWLRAAQRYSLHYLQMPLAQERIHGTAKTSVGGVSRIQELERLGKQYGGQGIPRNFRPEAAAVYLYDMFGALAKGQPRTAWDSLRQAQRIKPSVFKLMLYLGGMLVYGQARIPRLRLYSNRLRQYAKKNRFSYEYP